MTEDTEPGATLEAVRDDLDQRLPGLIDQALRRYLDFTKAPAPTDAKDFGAYSTACRSAVSHLEQLLKLARLTAPVAPDAPAPADNVSTLIANAEAALDKAAGETETAT